MAKVIRIISGQMWRRTVASFGSGSDLSFGLKIRYDLVGITEESAKRNYLDAPQESDKTDMQRETIWVVLTCPVLSTMANYKTNHYNHKLNRYQT